MKKSLLAIAFAMVAMVGSAQIYVGGSLGLDFSGKDNSSRTGFGIYPEVGYVLNENLSFGAAFGFGTTSTKSEIAGVETKSSSNNWNFTPYARYTFFNSGIFSCFVDGVIAISGAKNSDATFGIFAKPGIALSVTENISLVSHLGSLGWSNANSVNNFVLNADASIAKVGVYYTF